MRSYHIVPKEIAQIVGRHAYSWHWAELPDGSVLLSSEFRSESEQERFESHCTVEPLPHLFDPSPLEEKHIARFQHLGLRNGHTMKDLRKLAKQKLHRLL